MARHKPAAQGGYQRGEETRARVIFAALKVFGERGFEGASTRDIASEAGVNAPALQYYFDNKEGLYLACVEFILGRMWEQLGDAVAGADAALANPHSSDEALIDALLGILGGFISFIQDSPRAVDWRLFMAREQAGQGPPQAFQTLDHSFNQRIGGLSRQIIARLTGYAVDDERTILHSFSIISQGMVFRVLRRQVLSALGWNSIDQARMLTVRELLFTQARLILRGLVAERDRLAAASGAGPGI
ncbi:CerR family C-terminal domain-containing protein [Pseudomonas sp. RIT-PI-S]|uniref:CerR family C-terminal domain-containing protein n=1 Tax=Pseudomonas sp. RIT-PI-S TaxID=3035295 RepID=UPI0021DA94AE|nr:CerR family C-terminal domain-containing protein [Pseudomonas sp. RIT-PI-S]